MFPRVILGKLHWLATLTWIVVQWTMFYPMTPGAVGRTTSTIGYAAYAHQIGSQEFCGWKSPVKFPSFHEVHFVKLDLVVASVHSTSFARIPSDCVSDLPALGHGCSTTVKLSFFLGSSKGIIIDSLQKHRFFGSGRHLLCVWCILQVRNKRDQK